jgi:hypothetical protein
MRLGIILILSIFSFVCKSTCPLDGVWMESNNNLRSWNFNASNNRVIIKNSKENFGTFSFEEIRSSSELKFK